jgi:hypothetical protein
MKNLKAPFLVIALLLNVLLMSAGSEHPPLPMAKSANALKSTDEDCEDLNNCEAQFPIDENVVFLLVVGVTLGLTVIYKNQIKKASI